MLPPVRNPCSPSSSESRSLVIIVARNDGKRERGRPTPFISSHRFPRAAVLTIIVIVLFLENQWETAEERLHKSGQRLRRTKFRLSFLVAERFRYIGKLPSV